MNRQNHIFRFVMITLFFCANSYAAGQSDTLKVQHYLYAGPIEIHYPAFYRDSLQVKDIVELQPLDATRLFPRSGDVLNWSQDEKFTWNILDAETRNTFFQPLQQDTLPQLIYYVFYLQTQKWIEADYGLVSAQPFQLFFDGHLQDGERIEDEMVQDTLLTRTRFHFDLEPGKHRVVIKSFYSPLLDKPATIESEMITQNKSDLQISLTPDKHISMEDILEAPKPTNIQLSSDGKYAALTIKHQTPKNPSGEEWLELYNLEKGTLEKTLRGGYTISSFKWIPGGNSYSYLTKENGNSTLWIVDTKAGTSNAILKAFEGLRAYRWAPNASFVIFSAQETAKSGDDLKRHLALMDRIPGWRNKQYLYRLNVPQGTVSKLTSGNLSTHLSSISPDAKKLIFQRRVEELNNRPYIQNQLFLLDLDNMSLDSLWYGYWLSDVEWSPDGKKLLMTGGPSLFGDIGKNVPDQLMPNEYDTQAYVYNLASGSVNVISKSFKPSIVSAKWSGFDGNIYVLTVDKSYQHLYQYDSKRNAFNYLDTGCEAIETFHLAENRSVIGLIGSGVTTPHKACIYEPGKQARVLAEPAEGHFKNVDLGGVESWTFYNKESRVIYGRIYYPPGFNPEKKYPCIVYYYGGTTPVERSFGGRYPKNVWAANGYVVYVMQPSGSVGFGQDFSALHVNDWGEIVADDIITGVEYFLKLHSFVDPKRVGCIGASYGGFMTMRLLTETDLFATAVAHAGISSLAGYWGEGYWGYLYSAVATANSFPWNRKDIYVDASPLYSADKITTPLLLLHGTDDTNVPPGESYQLYTSLKLLGRDVELVTVKGENHHILTFDKRLKWSKTIIAWFDKYLKDEPAWWEALYPAP
ncbi:prolyl oligopeptidase family serine peptidase [candidate division KSB1 bacterium]|nr:prolyl oligopeptidase family serine peptidase [candidate division KSB1 bacterium]